MELDACIKGRRSVRSYTNKPVSKVEIEAILEAGIWAPIAGHREPLKFVIIEDKNLIKYVSDETKNLMQQISPDATKQYSTPKDIICYNAPVLILICAEKNEELAGWNLLDSVLAAENMFLKAHDIGLGTCYMGLVSQLSSKPDVLKKLNVPENHDMLVPFILGHPKAKPAAGKRKSPTILKWIK